MRKLLVAIAAAFMATTSMTAASITAAEAAQVKSSGPTEQQSLDAFFNTGYGWCDAKVLSQLWNNDPSSAKVWAGEKILRGDGSVLDQVLGEAYTKYRCEIAFDFNDVQDVASLWETPPAV